MRFSRGEEDRLRLGLPDDRWGRKPCHPFLEAGGLVVTFRFVVRTVVWRSHYSKCNKPEGHWKVILFRKVRGTDLCPCAHLRAPDATGPPPCAKTVVPTTVPPSSAAIADGWSGKATHQTCVRRSLSVFVSKLACLANAGSRPTACPSCLRGTAVPRAHPHLRSTLTFA